MKIKKDPSSFRDPSGGIFYRNNTVYRWVAGVNCHFYMDLVASDLFKEIVKLKYHIETCPAHFEDSSEVIERFGSEACFFRHESIEFLTFPFEWPISVILESARFTLNLQHILLENK